MYKIQRQQKGLTNDLVRFDDIQDDNLGRDIPREELMLISSFLDKFMFI